MYLASPTQSADDLRRSWQHHSILRMAFTSHCISYCMWWDTIRFKQRAVSRCFRNGWYTNESLLQSMSFILDWHRTVVIHWFYAMPICLGYVKPSSLIQHHTRASFPAIRSSSPLFINRAIFKSWCNHTWREVFLWSVLRWGALGLGLKHTIYCFARKWSYGYISC